MRSRSFLGGTLLLVVLVVAACITVNIYFPAPEVRAAAEEIVEETWGGGPGEGGAQPEARGSMWRPAGWLGPRMAHAEGKPNIEVSTAAIRTLKAAMKGRAETLKPYLATGNVGIGRDGMLVVRNLDGVGLRDQATVRRLVDAENRDRDDLYAEIAVANDFERDHIDDIKRIFAETWIAKAESGWWIQKPDKTWTQAK